jgi:hypothetical protein
VPEGVTRPLADLLSMINDPPDVRLHPLARAEYLAGRFDAAKATAPYCNERLKQTRLTMNGADASAPRLLVVNTIEELREQNDSDSTHVLCLALGREPQA